MKYFIILTLVVLLCVTLQPYMSYGFQSFLYTISLTIKEGLLFILPAIVFMFISNGLIKLRMKAAGFTVLLAVMICVSNFNSTWLSYLAGRAFISGVAPMDKQFVDNLEPMWITELPHLFSNNQAIILGLIFSVVVLLFSSKHADSIIELNTKVATFLLKKCLTPIIPVFIAGFVIHSTYSNIFDDIVDRYNGVLMAFIITTAVYLVFLYILIFGKGVLSKIKNMMPPVFTAFSTMSSALSMPLLMIALEKNTQRKDLTDPVIPPITNFHLIGDCFFIPPVAIAIMEAYGMPIPDFSLYLDFSLKFILAKFAVAAVPSGGIIVMLPILQSTFDFNGEMLSLITVVYVLFDSIITSINVMGNGAFSALFVKLYTFVFERNRP